MNFPTKGEWRNPSKLSDVERGLDDLARVIKEYDVTSIAVPPLGCGNGGLDWGQVRPLIERKLGAVEGLTVHLYGPDGAPAANSMQVSTKRPAMTTGRAVVIAVLDRYLAVADGASRLVVQKLAYLAQQAGAPLKLDFVKAQYGPYAEQLNHVLQAMEGHYTTGYGDRSSPSPLVLVDGAAAEAAEFLAERPELRGVIDRVADVIDGLESPYGLELLASVHYVAMTIQESENSQSTRTTCAGSAGPPHPIAIVDRSSAGTTISNVASPRHQSPALAK